MGESEQKERKKKKKKVEKEGEIHGRVLFLSLLEGKLEGSELVYSDRWDFRR